MLGFIVYVSIIRAIGIHNKTTNSPLPHPYFPRLILEAKENTESALHRAIINRIKGHGICLLSTDVLHTANSLIFSRSSTSTKKQQ